MIIKKLLLRNFRNYEKEEISFFPGMNIVTGPNAQGKTNLLESLYILSMTRSYRVRSDDSLIRNGEQYAQIGCIYDDEIEKRIDIVIRKEGKTLLVRKQPVKKSSEFIGLLNVILFSPDDMGIFADAPRERRKILNQEITKVSPVFLNALSGYQALLKERNALLKTEDPDIRYLDVLDDQMIAYSAVIIRERRKFIGYMNEFMPDIYRRLADADQTAGLRYLSVVDAEEEDIEGALGDLYMNYRLRDLENKVTGTGVHREDIEFTLDDVNVLHKASQGQKRMSLLSFKLALLRFAEETSGKKPVLLLDDVLSELDRNRQQKLIGMVGQSCQCIITATEYPSFLKDSGISEVRIENGRVVREEERKR